MKILNPSQIKELDAYTIEMGSMKSVDLMERASLEVVHWIRERYEVGTPVSVFCGPGNNGGDGLAVARLLLEDSFQMKVYILESNRYSEDFKINEERLKLIASPVYINNLNNRLIFSDNELIIDAILGSGLNKPLEGLYEEVVTAINSSHKTVVSIDIASGLYADKPMVSQTAIQPDVTLSFQLPKLAFMLPENEKYIGDFYLLDIGLDQEFISQASTGFYFIDRNLIKSIFRRRDSKFSHKNDFGKVLVVAGSYGMMGAAILTSKAALRTGCGVLRAYIPECGYDIFQNALPEAIAQTDPQFKKHSVVPDLHSYDGIGIGPGIDEGEGMAQFLEEFLEKSENPVVLDAGALNLISRNKYLIRKIPVNSILTPHPGEFQRLAGKAGNDYERLSLLQDFAKETQCIIILKGAHTAICSPEGKVFFNSTGNPGMATPGSGDVLTGILTSLIAQKYVSLEAAILGVYLHGYAGDKAASVNSFESLLAGDIIENIKSFFLDFSR